MMRENRLLATILGTLGQEAQAIEKPAE